MKKKMLLIIGVILILMAALYFVINYKNKQAIDNQNPYGKEDLNQATIDQLDDPLYGNQIVPEELNKQIESGEEVAVYFYSPTCSYCQRTTPILVPLTEELNIDMKKLNLLEFNNEWGIESTPTLIYYKDGKEVDRIVGQHTEEEFREFFETVMK